MPNPRFFPFRNASPGRAARPVRHAQSASDKDNAGDTAKRNSATGPTDDNIDLAEASEDEYIRQQTDELNEANLSPGLKRLARWLSREHGIDNFGRFISALARNGVLHKSIDPRAKRLTFRSSSTGERLLDLERFYTGNRPYLTASLKAHRDLLDGNRPSPHSARYNGRRETCGLYQSSTVSTRLSR